MSVAARFLDAAGHFRYDDPLREHLRRNVLAHDRRAYELDGRKHAAVAIIVVDSDEDPHTPVRSAPDRFAPIDESGADGRLKFRVDGGAAVLLCRRAARLRGHPGQWALPGGRVDDGESAVEAALRETREELGLAFEPSSVLGLLDDYPTRSGYVVTPVVIWAGGPVSLDPQPDEVAYVYRVGLHVLCAEDSPRFISIPESDRPVVQVPVGGYSIHAPTGAVLVQFRWVALEAKVGTRVDGFEQPVFAWK